MWFFSLQWLTELCSRGNITSKRKLVALFLLLLRVWIFLGSFFTVGPKDSFWNPCKRLKRYVWFFTKGGWIWDQEMPAKITFNWLKWGEKKNNIESQVLAASLVAEESLIVLFLFRCCSLWCSKCHLPLQHCKCREKQAGGMLWGWDGNQSAMIQRKFWIALVELLHYTKTFLSRRKLLTTVSG